MDSNITDPEGLGELDNAGEECWWECNKQQGKCDWCGTEGWCCRIDWTGNGCDGSIGGTENHQCVLNGVGQRWIGGSNIDNVSTS